MTTRKFSTINLAHPKHSFEIGCLDLKERKNINLSMWLPRFIGMVQTFEAVDSDHEGPIRRYDFNRMLACYTVIEDARPELFLRRDFITDFVNKGTVYLYRLNGATENSFGSDCYQIFTQNNVLSIVMDEKQYRRFGLIAKKVIMNRNSKSKTYRVDIDLNDEKIKLCNKYQDRLISTMRRLTCISKLYFRWVPSERMSLSEANEKSLIFFRFVIDEYANDGCQPVPLKDCYSCDQRMERKWTNYSQIHPSGQVFKEILRASGAIGTKNIGSAGIVDGTGSEKTGIQRDSILLSGLMDLIDWLGYQMLSLDCNREEISSSYSSTSALAATTTTTAKTTSADQNHYDVTCSQFSGLFDYHQIQDKLEDMFGCGIVGDEKEEVALRALILYSVNQGGLLNESSVVLMQDSFLKTFGLVTVAAMSSNSWH